MKKNILLSLIITIFCAFSLFAQEKDNISPEETINYINSKLTGIAELENKRGLLVVTFFRNGQKNRVDKVPIEDLNPEDVDYKNDEKAIVIRCIVDNCIDRKIDFPKTIGHFSRISFAGNFDAKSQKGLIRAFEHLIMMFRDDKYKNNKPFEE